jgi:serine/threonine-protein kinase
MGVLLYRAALVPSEPRRTAWISGFAVAPLPFMTYAVYTRQPSGAAPASAYTVYSFLFAALTVVLTMVVSKIIYGLRQTIREARRLGPYTLVEKIGEGGMGAVYRAKHALLRRPTAIKILPPERAGQIDLARFEREVQMTSQLTSPHTVSIYDYGRTPDGLFYYAMEYLDGIDLDELVRRDGPMPPARAAHVLGQVCRALEEAHGVGLIHRDIKPANILLCHRGGTPDMAKVVDFGLVKDLQARREGVTLENTVLGTPHYMAPEAISSPERLDARSDLYALGAVGYFLLTGKVVFDGETAMDVFAQHLREAPVAPSARLGRPIPAGLEELLLAALAKQPEARPQSARAFREALSACADVPPWPETAAAAWWRERGETLKRARAGEPSLPSEERTLVVDVGADRATG